MIKIYKLIIGFAPTSYYMLHLIGVT